MIGEGSTLKMLMSKGDQLEGEVDDIEGRVTYHRIRVEGGINLAPPT